MARRIISLKRFLLYLCELLIIPDALCWRRTCTFDTGWCGWHQSTTDGFDWSRRSGPILNGVTGDHSGNGSYMFLDDSGATSPDDNAMIISPVIVVGQHADVNVTFYYHMSGAGVGNLSLVVFDKMPHRVVWHQSGDQGPGWKRESTHLKVTDKFQLGFTGNRVRRHDGGTAVDDVTFSSDTQASFVTQPPPTTKQHHKTVSASSISTAADCSFDTASVCSYNDNSGIPGAKWAWYKDAKGNGYVEARVNLFTPSTNDSVLRFNSPLVRRVRGLHCIAWRYESQGQEFTPLKVFLTLSGFTFPSTPVWTGSPTNGTWTSARVSISPLTDFEIVFEVEILRTGNGFTRIDDVSITSGSCDVSGKTTMPPTTLKIPRTSITCDFETFCGFEQRSGQWNLTKDGDGFFAILSNTSMYDKSYLITPPVGATRHACLEFARKNVNSASYVLKVNLIEKNRTSRLVWKSPGAAVVWKEERLHFVPAEEFQIEFEGARVSPEYGAIAIDDVKLYSGHCNLVSLKALSCYFGDMRWPYCRYTSTLSSWIIDHVSPFPGTDPQHTQGWFTKVDASSQPINATIRLVSPEVVSNKDIYCLSFDYYFKSYGIAELQFLLKDGNLKTDIVLWRRRNRQSNSTCAQNRWTSVKVNIPSFNDGSQAIFQALTGTSQNGEVGLDNILFNLGKCADYGCNFDSGLCGYRQNIFGKGNRKWLVSSHNTSSNINLQDHTTGNGSFLYLPSDLGSLNNFGSARLFLPVVKTNMFHCIQFWYYISSGSSISLSLHTQPTDSTQAKQLWFFEFDMFDSWQKVMVDVQAVKNSWIFIDGDTSFAKSGFAAIDDISLTHGCCNQKPLCRSSPCLNSGTCIETIDMRNGPNYLCKCKHGYTGRHCETAVTSPTSPATFMTSHLTNVMTSAHAITTHHVASAIDCNFDQNLCGYDRDPSTRFRFRWLPTQEGRTRTEGTGPKRDHTTGAGDYIYVEAGNGFSGSDAYLTSPEQPPVMNRCLVFWYHMYGQHIGTLNVQIAKGDRKTTVWTLSGEQGNEWRQGQVDINVGNTFKVVFEAIKTSAWGEDKGDIALDDISLDIGHCMNTTTTKTSTTSNMPTASSTSAKTKTSTAAETTTPLPVFDGDCTFDNIRNTVCGYKDDLNDDFDWILNSGSTFTYMTGPDGDHTSGKGNYMYVESSFPRKAGDVARLISPQIVGGRYSCFTFWYSMYGHGIGKLQVYVSSKGKESLQWSKHHDKGPSWQMGEVDLSSQKDDFQVVFEGIVGQNYTSDIAIDDILFIPRQSSSSHSTPTSPPTTPSGEQPSPPASVTSVTTRPTSATLTTVFAGNVTVAYAASTKSQIIPSDFSSEATNAMTSTPDTSASSSPEGTSTTPSPITSTMSPSISRSVFTSFYEIISSTVTDKMNVSAYTGKLTQSIRMTSEKAVTFTSKGVKKTTKQPQEGIVSSRNAHALSMTSPTKLQTDIKSSSSPVEVSTSKPSSGTERSSSTLVRVETMDISTTTATVKISGNKAGQINPGVIAGPVVGGIVLTAIVVLAIVLWRRRRGRTAQSYFEDSSSYESSAINFKTPNNTTDFYNPMYQ